MLFDDDMDDVEGLECTEGGEELETSASLTYGPGVNTKYIRDIIAGRPVFARGCSWMSS